MKHTNCNKKVINIKIAWIFVSIIIIVCIIAFFKNYILATNQPMQSDEIKEFEKNENQVNILKVMIENTDNNQKLVNEEREINFETEYEENANLPKDEEQVKQEGINGKLKVTALQEYKNGNMINEKVVESQVEQEATKKIIYKGTSEFLSKYNVHIGDTMYLMEIADLKEEAKSDSNTLCTINRYLNVTILEDNKDFIKVKYSNYEGYIDSSKLTSETVTPMITEKNRVANLKNNLSFDMDLNKVSGLTLSDFKTILSGINSDKNNIFATNAETFYNVEQKYKVNGVFIASIGIHESAWGTSSLAVDKHNLFGFAAYDRDPYNSATYFETYEKCIDEVGKALAKNYLNAAGTEINDDLTATASYYNGATATAVNTRYASDENWANKVYNYMVFLYNRL